MQCLLGEGRSAEKKSKVYAKHKPGFPKLPTLLVTKVRPWDEAFRGKLLSEETFRVRKISFASFSNLAPLGFARGKG